MLQTITHHVVHDGRNGHLFWGHNRQSLLSQTNLSQDPPGTYESNN